MDWIKQLLPTLGTALGGPLGTIAATFIADKIGVEEKTVKAVSEALATGAMTPEQLSSLKQAELEFQKYLQDNNIKLEEIAAADRSSARDMLKSTQAKTPAVLTYVITVGFFGVLGAMFYWPEVKESAPLMIMLGSLGTAWTGACAFWFGTTHGSQAKNDLLANSKPVGG